MDNVVEIKGANGSTWMPYSEYVRWQEFAEQRSAAFVKHVIFGVPYLVTPREDENVKYAYVTIGGNQVMVGVDNKTMKAYRLRDDIPTWHIPLQPLEYDSFVRWCTSMDL